MLHALMRLVHYQRDRAALLELADAFLELEGVSTDVKRVVYRALATDRDHYAPVWLEEVLVDL